MAADEAFFKSCLIIFSVYSTISNLSQSRSYGKHRRPTATGKTIPAPIAWFLFESPALWLTLLLFPLGKNHSNPKSIIHISFYLIHYFHRVVIYPLVMFLIINRKNPKTKTPKSGGHDFPIRVIFVAATYNLLNAYIQSRSASEYTDYGNDDNDKWFFFRFFIGMPIFAIGMAINVSSDYALLRLKSDQTTSGKLGEGKNEYKIPKGGMFELVSCPHYFGEIMELFGWTIVTCGWAPFLFFLSTCGFLIPRGFAHHKWYLDKFGEEYPKNRKAVIPFVC